MTISTGELDRRLDAITHDLENLKEQVTKLRVEAAITKVKLGVYGIAFGAPSGGAVAIIWQLLSR